MQSLIKKTQTGVYNDQEPGGFFIALTAASSKGQEGAPIRYENNDGKWCTIGVVTRCDSDVYNADDDNKEDYDYDGDEEQKKFTVGNLLTQ